VVGTLIEKEVLAGSFHSNPLLNVARNAAEEIARE
jgi:hypothetical protein